MSPRKTTSVKVMFATAAQLSSATLTAACCVGVIGLKPFASSALASAGAAVRKLYVSATGVPAAAVQLLHSNESIELMPVVLAMIEPVRGIIST